MDEKLFSSAKRMVLCDFVKDKNSQIVENQCSEVNRDFSLGGAQFSYEKINQSEMFWTKN